LAKLDGIKSNMLFINFSW